MDRSPTWRPVPCALLALRAWDDEVVVYDDATGSTHHLAGLGAEVLLALVRHPSGIATQTLVKELGLKDGDEDAPLAAELDGVLARLAELRLATRDRA